MKWLTNNRKYYLYRGLIKRIVVPILFIYFLDQGLTLAEIGSILAIAGIIGIILEVPSGTIADLLGHKRTLVISSLLQGLSMLLYITLDGYTGMLVGTVVYWGAGTLMTGTNDAFFYELLEKRKQTHLHKKYWGRAFAVANGMGVIFLSISSLLYVWHPTIPFIAGIVQFVLSAVLIGSIVEVSEKRSVAKYEGYAGLRKSARENKELLRWSHPFMWLGIFQSIYLGMAYGVAEFHQLFLEEIGLFIVYLGIIFACNRLLTMLSSFYAHRVLNYISPPIIFWITTAWSLTLLIFYIAVDSQIVAAVLVILPSIFWGLLRVTLNDVQNKFLKTGSRSSFLSLFNLGSNLVKVCFVFFIGLVATQLSVQLTLFLVPFIVAVPLLITLIFFHRTFLNYQT